jgi:hypothetical protein
VARGKNAASGTRDPANAKRSAELQLGMDGAIRLREALAKLELGVPWCKERRAPARLGCGDEA